MAEKKKVPNTVSVSLLVIFVSIFLVVAVPLYLGIDVLWIRVVAAVSFVGFLITVIKSFIKPWDWLFQNES